MRNRLNAIVPTIGALMLLPGVARSAPAPAPAPSPAPAAEGGGFDFGAWFESFRDVISGNAMVVGERIVLAILLFIVGWLVAKAVAYMVYRILCATTLDNKLADKLQLSLLTEGSKEGAKRSVDHLERFVAAIVYYILMLLVVVGVLEYAGLSQAAGPIEGLVETVIQALPRVGKAVIILVVAYFAGLLLSKLITRALGLLRVDARFAELTVPSGLQGEPVRPFSQHAGGVAFWLVMMVGLAGATEALEIAALSGPLSGAIERVIGVVPSIGVAALLVFGGYLLGRVVRVIVGNLLESVGLDRGADRLGVGRLFGGSRPSKVVGLVAFAFVLFQATIAALGQLGLNTLAEPLTAMMGRFWLLLPALAGSALIVGLGVVVGRVLRGAVAGGLRGLGFDGLLARLGFGTIAEREDRLGEPSELAGYLVQAGVLLLAVAQGLANLHLDTWAGHVDALLAYMVKHVLVALVVVAIGFGIGNYVRDLIAARQGEGEGRRWVAELGRGAVLVFAFTMAVRQLDVAEDFVLLAFGLLFGALCLAAALAFGLGAREVAGEIVKKRYQELQGKGGGSLPAPGFFSRPPRDGGGG